MKEFACSSLSLAFIDGLHTFEQVLKDFINVERYADSNTVVLIHDCLPVASILATPVPETSLWCGDVWKIIPCLMQTRPDLRVSVIPTQPSGLAMVTNLNRDSTSIKDNLNQIIADYSGLALKYEYLDMSENALSSVIPGVIPNEWQEIRKVFSKQWSDLNLAFQ